MPPTPQHQIRAHFDADTITLYQAYAASIASAAVLHQRLTASEEFSCTRMTWVKPSWGWMMYRSGYSWKDERQARILALKMTHENFRRLLGGAVVVHNDGRKLTEEQRGSKGVRVQWDPERDPYLHILPYRSIQIGIGPAISKKWAEEWVETIEDVTEKARELKRIIDGGGEDGEVGLEELVERGLVPTERVYDVGEELRGVLEMD